MRDHKGRHPLDRTCDPVDGQICIGTDKGKPPMTSRITRSRAYAAAVITAALTVGLTACGGSDNTADPTPTVTQSPTPTKSLSPEEQATKNAQAALDRYFALNNKMAADPKIPLTKLQSVAISVGLTYAQQEIRSYRFAGEVLKGDATYELLKVESTSLSNQDPQKGDVPTVQFRVCWDISDVKVTKNGKPVDTSKRKDRSVATYSVSNYKYAKNPDGGWKVSSFQRKMDESC